MRSIWYVKIASPLILWTVFINPADYWDINLWLQKMMHSFKCYYYLLGHNYFCSFQA